MRWFFILVFGARLFAGSLEMAQIYEKIQGEKICGAIAKDGAKVSITIGNFEHSMFQIHGEGFKPYESLNFISTSCDEVAYFQIETDEHGYLPPTWILPAVIGKSGGICHVDILREGNFIYLKFPWGSEKN
jgi:hypothetical protein